MSRQTGHYDPASPSGLPFNRSPRRLRTQMRIQRRKEFQAQVLGTTVEGRDEIARSGKMILVENTMVSIHPEIGDGIPGCMVADPESVPDQAVLGAAARRTITGSDDETLGEDYVTRVQACLEREIWEIAQSFLDALSELETAEIGARYREWAKTLTDAQLGGGWGAVIRSMPDITGMPGYDPCAGPYDETKREMILKLEDIDWTRAWWDALSVAERLTDEQIGAGLRRSGSTDYDMSLTDEEIGAQHRAKVESIAGCSFAEIRAIIHADDVAAPDPPGSVDDADMPDPPTGGDDAAAAPPERRPHDDAAARNVPRWRCRPDPGNRPGH